MYYKSIIFFSVGEEKMSKAIKNQNKYSKKNKREHSPQSDDEPRKKMDVENDS